MSLTGGFVAEEPIPIPPFGGLKGFPYIPETLDGLILPLSGWPGA